jgi:hypothetical protein
MEQSALMQLMHEVLDGAASADEARELERLLANDPGARAQFEELGRLFKGLNAMPMATPPEGLVAAVLARLPQQHTRRDRLHQLSSRWRVLRVDSRRAQGSLPIRTSRTQLISQHKSIRRNRDMSGPNIFSRKPKLWIGAGIAVVAIVLVARYFDFPPGRDTQGTIAPAKRAIAEQPGAGDVNGGQSDGSRPVPPASGDAAGDAGRGNANDAGRGNANDAGRGNANDAGRGNANDAGRGNANDAGRGNANDAGRGNANDAGRGNANDAGRGNANDAGRGNANDAARGNANDAARGNANDAAR